MSEEIFQLQVWFSGCVQGVGFRYQVLQIAREFEVCGSVQNLADGRVYLLVEADQPEAEAFKQEIELQMGSYIKEVEVRSSFAAPSCEGFQVIH